MFRQNPDSMPTEGNRWSELYRTLSYDMKHDQGVSDGFIDEAKTTTRKTKGQTYQMRTTPDQTKQIKNYLK